MNFFSALFLILMVPAPATLQQQTLDAWNSYIQTTEKRIENESATPSATTTTAVTGPHIDVPGGMIHDWRGAIFVPGITLDALLRWLQDYDHHSRYFKNVEQSKLLSRNGETFHIFMRLTRSKIVTVHYNTEHTAIYQKDRPGQASSRSFTTKIAEIENAGTPSERELPPGRDSGYMWRLNSYWRFREQDSGVAGVAGVAGVIVECESVSLSRSIPFGLGWLIGRYIESVPKESLQDTLTSIRDGVVHSR
jgi:hypothetical protein